MWTLFRIALAGLIILGVITAGGVVYEDWKTKNPDVVEGFKAFGSQEDAVKVLNAEHFFGDWETKGTSPKLTAGIYEGTLEIRMHNEGSSMLYWVGTFQVPDGNGVVRSTAKDVNAMVLSGYKEKDFYFQNERMSFVLQIAGVETNVVMERA